MRAQGSDFGRQVKRVLAEAIQSRWKSELRPQDISGMIERADSRLQQFCIRLSADEAFDRPSRKVASRKLKLPIGGPAAG